MSSLTPGGGDWQAGVGEAVIGLGAARDLRRPVRGRGTARRRDGAGSVPGAVVPEAVIAVVTAVGAGSILARLRTSRVIASAASALAILGTCYGLTATVPRGDAGDIAYHVGILAMLVLVVGMLLAGRRAPRKVSAHP